MGINSIGNLQFSSGRSVVRIRLVLSSLTRNSIFLGSQNLE